MLRMTASSSTCGVSATGCWSRDSELAGRSAAGDLVHAVPSKTKRMASQPGVTQRCQTLKGHNGLARSGLNLPFVHWFLVGIVSAVANLHESAQETFKVTRALARERRGCQERCLGERARPSRTHRASGASSAFARTTGSSSTCEASATACLSDQPAAARHHFRRAIFPAAGGPTSLGVQSRYGY